MKTLFKDKKGVIDLPMRLMVTLIIGGAVLGMIVYYISSNCWIKENLQVNWYPSVITLSENIDTYSVEIVVKDEKGNPIQNAFVTITGLGYASGKTDNKGNTKLDLTIELPEYRNEGYLDLEVRAGDCYKKFYQEDAIKVVRGK